MCNIFNKTSNNIKITIWREFNEIVHEVTFILFSLFYFFFSFFPCIQYWPCCNLYIASISIEYPFIYLKSITGFCFVFFFSHHLGVSIHLCFFHFIFFNFLRDHRSRFVLILVARRFNKINERKEKQTINWSNYLRKHFSIFNLNAFRSIILLFILFLYVCCNVDVVFFLL